MQRRTIKDIFDKRIGHIGFARFIRYAQADNIVITDIKEYYEKYTFKVGKFPFAFVKNSKDIKWQYKFFKDTYEMQLDLERKGW